MTSAVAPLRVMLVNGNFEDGSVGGTQTFTLNLAHALADDGHVVGVLCQSEADRRERTDGIQVFRVRPPRLDIGGGSYWTYLVNQTLAIQNPLIAPRVAAALREFRPDVCHVQMLRRLTPTVLAILSRHQRTAVVQTVHESFSLWNFNAYQRHDSPDKLFTKRPAVVGMLKRRHRQLSATVDHVCAPSAHALAPYLEDGYFEGVPRTLIPNAVPSEWGDPLLAAAQRRTTTVADENIRFVFIGRLDHYKGVRTLLDAFRSLDTSTARLEIGGEGILSTEVENRAQQDPRITFYGAVDPERRRQIMRDADVLVCPSTWPEAFGLVVLEAYASGLPVIASRAGALPDLVEDGQTGLVVEPGSVMALNRAMRQVHDPGLRRKLAHRAAERTRSFQFATFVREQVAVYHSAIMNARAGTVGQRDGSRRTTTVTSWRL